MKPLTYKAYLKDPLIREQLEREVRRARSEAIGRFFATLFKALVPRRQPRTIRVLVPRTA